MMEVIGNLERGGNITHNPTTIIYSIMSFATVDALTMFILFFPALFIVVSIFLPLIVFTTMTFNGDILRMYFV